MRFQLLLCLLCSVQRCTAISCSPSVVEQDNGAQSDECEKLVGEGSICLEDGFCSVPQLEGGCLQAMIPDVITRKRVCNSEDPPNAQELGLCENPELPYTEVRVFSGNWDSILYQSWLVQIILSELLGVPTTIEGGTAEAALNFYHASQPITYGTAPMPDKHGSFQKAYEYEDCTKANKNRNPDTQADDPYEGCAHVSIEQWNTNLDQDIREGVRNGKFESLSSLGMLGRESVYITKFTLEQNPSFGNYMGLMGEARRKLLAAKFLRPYSWKDYCDKISRNNCTATEEDAGAIAKRYPDDDLLNDEGHRYFVDGLYTGHFAPTEENDCTLNNETFQCTGHVADFPCSWSSFMEADMYHLGIALQSSGREPNSRGYTYQEMNDVWQAANATRSNLLMYYWTPETLYQKFIGTNAEMVPVAFPATTQECLENKVLEENTCSESKDVRVGSPLGVCEAPITLLQKMLVSSLQTISKNPNQAEAIHSPAYDMIRSFQFTEYQLGEIIQLAGKEASPRLAVCRWAADNIGFLQQFSPQSYPRVIRVEMRNALSITTTTIGCLVTLVVLWTAWRTYQHRDAHIIKIAQIEFLGLLLAGSLMISIGAILTGLKPQTPLCIASVWLINVGYTLELIPLIVKVWAICRLMAAARRMEPANFSRGKLYGAVTIVLGLIVLYLSIWTAVDNPKQQAEYSLGGEEGERTVVQKSYYCSSEAKMWQYVAVAWNVALLLVASVMAFLMRGAHAILNESGTLAVMVYSHFFFVVFRVVTFLLSGRVEENILMQVRSLIYSVDTVATVLIYFVPKLCSVNNDIQMSQKRLTTVVADASRKRFSMFKSRMHLHHHQSKEFGSGSILDAHAEHVNLTTVGLTDHESDTQRPSFVGLDKEDFTKEELKKAPSRVGAQHMGGSSCQPNGRNPNRKKAPSYVGAHHVGGRSNDNALDPPVDIGSQHAAAMSDGTSSDQGSSREMRKILQERASAPPRVGAQHVGVISGDGNSGDQQEDRVMRKILQERASAQSWAAPQIGAIHCSPSNGPSSSNQIIGAQQVGAILEDGNSRDQDNREMRKILQERASAPPQVGAQHVGAMPGGNSGDQQEARVMRKILQERASTQSGGEAPQIGAIHCTPSKSPDSNNLPTTEEGVSTGDGDGDKVMRKILQERISFQSGDAPPPGLLATTVPRSPSENQSTYDEEEGGGKVENQRSKDDWQDEE